ncbi:hypothetical protein GOODEAATRI_010205 [Goodea atripinnis]|uniref:Uncharacterized protein n=1 Tax=Goodea atripinnis TaxID=208336 RepID=A0ABV0MQY6_9TELE
MPFKIHPSTVYTSLSLHRHGDAGAYLRHIMGTWRGPMHARGEHTNSMQKDPRLRFKPMTFSLQGNSDSHSCSLKASDVGRRKIVNKQHHKDQGTCKLKQG